MKQIGNQIMYFGLGLWDFAKEKLNVLLEEITKRGALRREKDPHATDSVTERLKRDRKLLWDKSRAFVKKGLTELGLARGKDLETLQERVTALEEELRKRQTEMNPNP